MKNLVDIYESRGVQILRDVISDQMIPDLYSHIAKLQLIMDEINLDLKAREAIKQIDIAIKAAHGLGYRGEMTLHDFLRTCARNNISVEVKYNGT